MKKTFSFLLLLFMVLVSVAQNGSNAENSGAIAGRLGVYGGVNFADIMGDDDEENKTLTAFQFGLMYRLFSPGDLVSLWIEPGYNAIGTRFEESYQGQSYKSTVNLGYIMVPVLARFQAQNGLFGDIGVQPQFLVSAKVKADGDSEDIKDEVNGFDFGIPIGVGYEYNKKFGIRAGYYFGLNNIVKDPISDYKNTNTAFSIRLHYRF